jgi:protein-S-isoprenylcysteine O-methyltransferase Ste14
MVFIVALGLGMFLNWLIPSSWFSSGCLRITGALMGFIGTSLCSWGVYALHRAGTNVRPDRPVNALVTAGPFRYSRNPLYVGMTVIYVGICLSTGALWPLATLVPALVVVHWRIVLREEQYLESRFGDSYRAYKARVHRWI